MSIMTKPEAHPKIHCEFRGHRVRAVGKRIYVRPIDETFHEFILWLLHRTLGRDWWNSECSKTAGAQHQVIKWYRAFGELIDRQAAEHNNADGGHLIEPSGDAYSLLCLAYDVYQLLHSINLCEQTFRRLKKRHEFQGARYEIAVASVFARIGYKLEYSPVVLQVKHPEFVAVHPIRGDKISVEAKSRRRPGVLHETGDQRNSTGTTTEVRDLFARALAQRREGMPFAVFIDLNFPVRAKPTFCPSWTTDLSKMMESQFGAATPSEPDPFNALVITNFPYHYCGNRLAIGAERVLAVSMHPEHPFPGDLMNGILDAIYDYPGLPAERY